MPTETAHKFPAVITAFCTKSGEWSFDADCGPLFPVGQQHKYVDADCTRQAAILFNNPDNFSALLDAFLASPEPEVAGKLSDALNAVARAGKTKNEIEEIRARHQEEEKGDLWALKTDGRPDAHADRATLLRHIDRLKAEAV